jgi:threonine/homoserine/homoserine lactone efflux protein
MMLNLVPFLSYVAITTFTPGPNNIMSMTNAKQYGFKKTGNFILGVGAGFVVIMLMCSYFNLLLYNLVPRVKFVMGIVGAIYMLYLAFIILRNQPHSESKTRTYTNSFLAGMFLQFINAKVVFYGITVTANFITPFYKSNISLILFSFFLALIGLLATSSWAFFGAVMQKFLIKYQKPFDITMAALLVYCAVSASGLFH